MWSIFFYFYLVSMCVCVCSWKLLNSIAFIRSNALIIMSCNFFFSFFSYRSSSKELQHQSMVWNQDWPGSMYVCLFHEQKFHAFDYLLLLLLLPQPIFFYFSIIINDINDGTEMFIYYSFFCCCCCWGYMAILEHNSYEFGICFQFFSPSLSFFFYQ